ncbi:AP-3 complex subunit beta [Candida viswanathii]|uniref:AP-3 complex subunit beta n=1 Tax=Candida viswanathii TaxID=5486 RepID=A0A367Y0C1_9ASCO|nr:AP-3 complex subunit beta [Candida viswanathii]
MSDSLSKISSMIESAKELTIEAAVSASARLTDTPSASRPQEISKLLNSRTDREILNGMKCVISIVSRGEDGLPYFADVVKNITNTNAKIKQLVIIYLTKYADIEPDTALLSINSIQKSLNDKNPINRANAIRSLAGIRILSIIPILVLSMKRTSTDPSALVRAATAISIGKVYEFSGRSKKQMVEYLTKLLVDSEVIVVNAAIKSYCKIRTEIASEEKRWSPIHGNFRRLCGLLGQFDEWSQCYVIDLLTEYTRNFLPPQQIDGMIDADLDLFLEAMKPLVQSTSESVILSIARSVYLIGPVSAFQDFKLDVILTRIATAFTEQLEVSLFALEIIAYVSKSHAFFEPYYRSFYLLPTDLIDAAISKLQILSSLASRDNFKYIFEEFKYYAIHSPDGVVSKEAIKSMGRCSRLSLEWSQRILNWCLAKIKQAQGETLNELLTVIRYLIQQKSDSKDSLDREEVLRTTLRLAAILEDTLVELETEARASIIWIIGEYTSLAENSFAPDVLKNLLKSFADEEDAVRYQILVLASKILAYEMIKLKGAGGDQFQAYVDEKLSSSIEYKMFHHVLQLAKYDTSYDTRDRARMLSVLLSSIDRAQLASLFLQVPKPVPFVSSAATGNGRVRAIVEYFKVVDWADPSTLPPRSIRKEAAIEVNKLGTSAFASLSSVDRTKSPSPATDHGVPSQQVTRTSTKKPQETYKLQSLDEFFGSEESSSSEEEEEESDDEDEEDDDSDEEEEEDDSEAVASQGRAQGSSVHEQNNTGDEYESSSDASSTRSLIK